MPKVILVVSDEQKALWVEAAHAERLTLSEWIRRRCDGGLAAGDPGGAAAPRREGSSGFESQSVAPASPAPAASPPELVTEPEVQASAMQPGSGEDRDKPAAAHLEQFEAAIGREATGLEAVLLQSGQATRREQPPAVDPRRDPPPARSVPPVRAKEKAAQEHAPKERQRAKAQMCEHRVPLGQYCKRCAT